MALRERIKGTYLRVKTWLVLKAEIRHSLGLGGVGGKWGWGGLTEEHHAWDGRGSGKITGQVCYPAWCWSGRVSAWWNGVKKLGGLLPGSGGGTSRRLRVNGYEPSPSLGAVRRGLE